MGILTRSRFAGTMFLGVALMAATPLAAEAHWHGGGGGWHGGGWHGGGGGAFLGGTLLGLGVGAVIAGSGPHYAPPPPVYYAPPPPVYYAPPPPVYYAPPPPVYYAPPGY